MALLQAVVVLSGYKFKKKYPISYTSFSNFFSLYLIENISVMKKLLLLVGAFILIVISFSSCEEEDCMVCALVTYEDGVETKREREAEYCGGELDGKEHDSGTTIGNTTTIWECN